MYENLSYDFIIKRMLARASNSNDKREGSVVFDSAAMSAAEHFAMYIELNYLMDEAYPDSASREYLIRHAKPRGLSPNPASSAILKGIFTPSTIDVLGYRFNLNLLNYMVSEKISDGEYKVQCETAGTEGNKYLGSLIPIDYVDGLQTAELTELLTPGEDEEDTEDFRARYINSFNSTAFGGNKADYIAKTNAIPGVGATKPIRTPNGGGTVLLTILDSTYSPASESLVSDVQNIIDPLQDGEGDGLAPIDHVVTVQSASGVEINVAATLSYESGYSYDNSIALISAALDDYYLELRKSWQAQDKLGLVVRITQIESRILSIAGILDISGTKINGIADNLTLSKNEVPMPGGFTGGV